VGIFRAKIQFPHSDSFTNIGDMENSQQFHSTTNFPKWQ
jgi:hypothetical protein